MKIGRIATGVWGIFACFVALYATSLGSLIEVVNRFGSFLYGSLLSVLAIAVPRALSQGAFWGLLFGQASVWIASRFTDIAFLWFNVIGCLVVVSRRLLVETDRARSANISRSCLSSPVSVSSPSPVSFTFNQRLSPCLAFALRHTRASPVASPMQGRRALL